MNNNVPGKTSDPVPLQGRLVLVVEDDSDTLRMMTFVLEQNGAEVLPVDSVPAALEQFQSRRPDVILADIAMPGLNGYALIAEIRKIDAERGQHTPAIAVTAFSTPKDRDLAAASGFEGYVTKPFDPEALVDTIVQLSH